MILRYQPLACWMRFLPTWPASHATSHSPVRQDSCQPALGAMLLAAWLLNKVLASYTTNRSAVNEFLVALHLKRSETHKVQTYSFRFLFEIETCMRYSM